MVRRLKKEIWPYKITVNYPADSQIIDIELWLIEKFGERRNKWNVVYGFYKSDFYFKEESMLTFFAMRWN